MTTEEDTVTHQCDWRFARTNMQGVVERCRICNQVRVINHAPQTINDEDESSNEQGDD